MIIGIKIKSMINKISVLQIKNDYNYEDTLNVVAMDKEIAEWINDGYR